MERFGTVWALTPDPLSHPQPPQSESPRISPFFGVVDLLCRPRATGEIHSLFEELDGQVPAVLLVVTGERTLTLVGGTPVHGVVIRFLQPSGKCLARIPTPTGSSCVLRSPVESLEASQTMTHRNPVNHETPSGVTTQVDRSSSANSACRSSCNLTMPNQLVSRDRVSKKNNSEKHNRMNIE